MIALREGAHAPPDRAHNARALMAEQKRVRRPWNGAFDR